jgi:hypothetical protein
MRILYVHVILEAALFRISGCFLDLSEVKRALEAELQKCNSSCKESLENYIANMSTNADFQQVSDISSRDR